MSCALRYGSKLFRLHAARALLFLSLLLFVQAAPPAHNRAAGISRDQAMRDFRAMQTIFAQAHATAFAQMPQGSVPDLFAGSKQVSIRDFVTRVLGYYRGIHVDHTGLGFSPDLVEDLGLKAALFPFPLRFFDGRAFFDCEYNNIGFGAELLQINGKSLADALAEMNAFVPLRNDAQQWDDHRLTESFSFLYFMAKGAVSKWTVGVKTGDQMRTVTVDTGDGSGAAFVPRKSAAEPSHAQPLYIMFNPQLKAAYLAINTFMPSGNQLDSIESWNNHLNMFHREADLKKSENLVIDLRANRGGVMLFSAAAATWFIEKPVEDKSRSSARSRLLPYPEFVQAINGMAATEPNLKGLEEHLQASFADKMTNGYFETRDATARYRSLKPIVQAHRFKKIFVLLSPATYSAAVNFARLIKLGNANVQLVGEETGSPGDGHSAEFIITYKLPESGLLFEIPLVRVKFDPTLPGQPQGRGLKPDISLRETAADFSSGRDGLLEAVSRMMTQP